MVRVLFLTGDHVDIETALPCTVGQLKEQIAAKTGHPVFLQRLLFDQKEAVKSEKVPFEVLCTIDVLTEKLALQWLVEEKNYVYYEKKGAHHYLCDIEDATCMRVSGSTVDIPLSASSCACLQNFCVFSKLTNLIVENTPLTAIPDLSDLEALQILRISRNNIRVFDQAKLPLFLQVLHIAHNDITDVQMKNRDLQEINFSNNPLRKASFCYLPSLANLKLSGLAHYLPYLIKKGHKFSGKKLNLMFRGLPSLNNLEIDANTMDLDAVQHEFHGCDIRTANLAKNVFSAVPPFILSSSQLKLLHLSQNALVSLPSAMPFWTHLVSFNASENYLETAPNFKTLCSLEELNLSCNKLVSMLELPPSLKTLDLSCNMLTQLPTNMTKLTNLLRLNVRKNRLKAIALPFSRSFTILDLAHNCVGALDLSPVPRMQQLFAQDNLLTELRPNMSNYVTYVDVSQNPLTELPLHLLWDPSGVFRHVKLPKHLRKAKGALAPPHIGRSNVEIKFL